MRAGLTPTDSRFDRDIEVAICLDEALLLPAAVLLRSIAEHAESSRPVRVHVLTTFPVAELTALSPPDDAAFRLCAREVDNRFATLPRNDYISQGTYLRFMLPDLLPEVEKLIYLDIDMAVHRSLAPLADLDLGGLGLGAASDTALALGSTRWDTFDLAYEGRDWTFAAYQRDVLGLGDGHGDAYFNAGLLVIDLNHWRAHDIAGRTLDFLRRKPELKFMDQDALSHVMQGLYRRIDPRWNAMANCADKADRRLRTRLSSNGRRWEQARSLWRDDPWIVHFAGPHKPWASDRPVVHADIWWAYARRSRAWPRLEAAHEGYLTMCERTAGQDRPWLMRVPSWMRGG